MGLQVCWRQKTKNGNDTYGIIGWQTTKNSNTKEMLGNWVNQHLFLKIRGINEKKIRDLETLRLCAVNYKENLLNKNTLIIYNNRISESLE